MTKLLKSVICMLDGFSLNTTIGKFCIAGGALLASYFTPILGLLLTCFSCSILDMIYGLKVAHKQNKKLTSKKNWKGTLVKIREEFELILLTHLIEFAVVGPNVTCMLSGGVTIIIALTELWSIIENLNTLNPSGPWRMLGKFLKKKGEDYIGMEIDLNDKSDDKNNKSSSE